MNFSQYSKFDYKHFVTHVIAFLLIVACTKPTPDNHNLMATIADSDPLPELALTIRKKAIEYLIANSLPKIPVQDGHLPDLVKEVVLAAVKSQNIENLTDQAHPCFVAQGLIKPRQIFEAVQRAAVGKIPFADPNMRYLSPGFKGQLWKNVLNYDPTTANLVNAFESWLSELDVKKNQYSNRLNSASVASLGLQNVTFADESIATVISGNLYDNDLVNKAQTIPKMVLRCFTAHQVSFLSSERFGTDHQLASLIDLLSRVDPFEETSALGGTIASEDEMWKLGTFLAQKPKIIGLRLSFAGSDSYKVNPKFMQTLLSPEVRNKIRQIIVNASFLLHEQHNFLAQTFPNLDSLAIDDDLTEWYTNTSNDCAPRQRFGYYMIDAMGVIGDMIEYANQMMKIKNLWVRTSSSQLILPKIKSNLSKIQSLIIDGQPKNVTSDSIDVAQLARIFPDAQKISIKGSKIFETESIYRKLTRKTNWRHLDLSYCDQRSKHDQIKLPNDIFPYLEPVKTFQCAKINIAGIFDLKKFIYQPPLSPIDLQ